MFSVFYCVLIKVSEEKENKKKKGMCVRRYVTCVSIIRFDIVILLVCELYVCVIHNSYVV